MLATPTPTEEEEDSPQHPRLLGLDDEEEHEHRVEQVVSALLPSPRRQGGGGDVTQFIITIINHKQQNLTQHLYYPWVSRQVHLYFYSYTSKPSSYISLNFYFAF